ncbi:MAG: SOS response-associated peptidase family protein [Deltaproteobacteria bacterium]|nr:SOS response-associated peptidase family protein [Deltaproteobacteria bacterium]
MRLGRVGGGLRDARPKEDSKAVVLAKQVRSPKSVRGCGLSGNPRILSSVRFSSALTVSRSARFAAHLGHGPITGDKDPLRLVHFVKIGQAGLWSYWKSPTGEAIESFTILTTEPNDLMAQYHNRIPVILPLDKEQVWLNPEFNNPVLLKGLLKPLPTQFIEVQKVMDILGA